MNPLFSNLNNLNNVKMVMELMKSSKNPLEILEKFSNNNPQLQEVLKIYKNGGNAKDIFYKECEKRGVNPDEILQQIK